MTEEEGLCGGGSPPPDRGGEASGCQGGAQSTTWVSVTQDQVLVSVLLVHLTLTFPSSLVTHCSCPPGIPGKTSGLPTGLFPGFLYSSLTGSSQFPKPTTHTTPSILGVCCALSLEHPSHTSLLGVAFPHSHYQQEDLVPFALCFDNASCQTRSLLDHL